MVERILSLIQQSGLKDYAFEKQLGFAQGTIGNWRNGRNKLSSEAVIKVARYFDISADYLLCLTDEPTPLKQSSSTTPILPEFIKLSKDERFVNLVKLYNTMPEILKDRSFDYLTGLADGARIDINKK